MDHSLLDITRAEEVRGGRKWMLTWGVFVEELKKVMCMAVPMVLVSLLQYMFQVVSLAMAGHLSELSLSGVAIAASFTNVSGFSVLFGLAGGLETLCGQAYGAEEYRKFGTYIYSSVASLIPICVPISVIWIFTDKILILLGQNPEIAAVACRYAIWLIPALFAYAILQSLLRYFQSQSLILPMVLCFSVTLCFHVVLCCILLFKCEMGYTGAALAVSLSYWLTIILLTIYISFSTSCEKTRSFHSKDFFSCTKEFICFAVPSAFMVCLEWWTFEIIVLLAGLLPDSQLQTSVLSICLTISALHYYVQYGIGAAASTQVSNELGAENPQAARGVVQVVLTVSLIEVTIASTTLFFCRYMFGYAFSNEKSVVDYVGDVAPVLCLSLIADSILAVLGGVARGCGWQHFGAYINLAAYYVVGIPVSVILCFVFDLKAKGLWIGILAGSTLQAILLAIITGFTDWQKQATNARDRIFDGAVSSNNESPRIRIEQQ